LKGESIGARAGLAERIGADGVGIQAWQPTLLLFLRCPAAECVDDEGVVHVDQDRNSGIDGGDGFDSEDRVEKLPAEPPSGSGSRCPLGLTRIAVG